MAEPRAFFQESRAPDDVSCSLSCLQALCAQVSAHDLGGMGGSFIF